MSNHTYRKILSGSVLAALTMVSLKVNAQAVSGITPAMQRAADLYIGITGVSIGIDDTRIAAMATLIENGQDAAAAKIATGQADFYNVRVADIARAMSDNTESTTVGLNDFVATFVGIVRDNHNAQDMLTANYVYIMDPTLGYTIDPTSGNRVSLINNSVSPPVDLSQGPVQIESVQNNNYYDYIESSNLSLYSVLTQQNGQLVSGTHDIVSGTGSANQPYPHQNPDPAGLLTSYTFANAHLLMGTNRRWVEYTFREFMCTPMANMADASQPDDHVGQDVTREPGGYANTYLTTCKACHAVMDGFREAAAYLDIVTNVGFTNYTSTNLDTNLNQKPYTASCGTSNTGPDPKTYVNCKMNKVTAGVNADQYQFPNGYHIVDDHWVNHATGPTDATNFGWRGNYQSGKGAGAFGAAIASSFGFSKCMVTRAFSSMCNRAPSSQHELDLVSSLATDFEKNGYSMRGMFEEVAVQPECLGTLAQYQ